MSLQYCNILHCIAISEKQRLGPVRLEGDEDGEGQCEGLHDGMLGCREYGIKKQVGRVGGTRGLQSGALLLLLLALLLRRVLVINTKDDEYKQINQQSIPIPISISRLQDFKARLRRQ